MLLLLIAVASVAVATAVVVAATRVARLRQQRETRRIAALIQQKGARPCQGMATVDYARLARFGASRAVAFTRAQKRLAAKQAARIKTKRYQAGPTVVVGGTDRHDADDRRRA